MTDDSGKFRVDSARAQGALEARMDSLEDRFDKQDQFIARGFQGVHDKLDRLFAVENERKGETNAGKATWVKVGIISGALAGIAEAVKAWFSK